MWIYSQISFCDQNESGVDEFLIKLLQPCLRYAVSLSLDSSALVPINGNEFVSFI